jgi:hypothetical protein
MMGRPKKPDAERRGNILRIRLTVEERAALDEAANRTSEETSTWARDILLGVAGRAILTKAAQRRKKKEKGDDK